MCLKRVIWPTQNTMFDRRANSTYRHRGRCTRRFIREISLLSDQNGLSSAGGRFKRSRTNDGLLRDRRTVHVWDVRTFKFQLHSYIPCRYVLLLYLSSGRSCAREREKTSTLDPHHVTPSSRTRERYTLLCNHYYSVSRVLYTRCDPRLRNEREN